jgi:hypothetical protein
MIFYSCQEKKEEMEKQTNLRALDFLYEYGGKTQSEVSAI